MKTRVKLIISTAISFLLLVAASPLAAQEYEFKLHHLLSAQAPAHTQMLEPWARQVEENSNGMVKIEIYPSMSLGGRPAELVSQARDGVVDLVWTVNGYTPGLFPRTEVMELPTVYVNNPRSANLALFDMFEDELRQEYTGLEVMFLHVHAGQGIHMTDTLVRSPEDMVGLDMRIPTRTGAWIIEALGSNPIQMPVPELPQALQKGVVDGAFIPWEIIPPLKLQDQTKYQIEGSDMTRFGTTTFQVSMNKARWDSLPEEIQKAFKDASGKDWWGQVGDIWRGADDFGINLAVQSGNEHVVLTPEETEVFNSALEPVVDRWISEVVDKGIDGQGLVEKARMLVAENSN